MAVQICHGVPPDPSNLNHMPGRANLSDKLSKEKKKEKSVSYLDLFIKP